MSRLKSVAVVVAALLVAGVIAIGIAVHLLDPQSLANSLAAAVKADTGRELTLGAVSVTFLPRPALALREVRFGNAPWGSQPWLAQAGRVDAEFDLLALLSRRLRITGIEVADASVFLETDSEGRGNWVVGSAEAGTPPWLGTLQIDELGLESVAVAYRDGATKKTTAAQIASARLDMNRTIRLDARGTFSGKQVAVAGTVGSLRSLIADTRAYSVELEGKIGAASIGLHGIVENPRTAGGLKLALGVRSADTAEFAALFGANLPPLGPLSGAAQLTGSATSPALSGIDAKFGGGGVPEIRLQGAISDVRALRGIDLKIAASAKDAWRLWPAASGPQLPALRASARLRDAQKGYRVEELDLSITDRATNVTQQVVRGGQLAIDGGRLHANALQVSLGGAKITLDGSVPAAKKLAGLALGIALQGGELAELFKLFGIASRPIGPYEGRARVDGSLDALRLSAIDVKAGHPGRSVQVSGQIADLIGRRGMQLAIAASVSDATAAGLMLGIELPPMPPLRATARLQDTPGGYVFYDVRAALGRSSMQGRLEYARAEPRPRISTDLNGPLLDLSELQSAQRENGKANPLLAADVDAKFRFERVVLPNGGAIGPVSGSASLSAGALDLKQFTIAVEGASATLEGRIGDPLKLAAVDLTVDAQVARAAGIEAFAGTRLPFLPAFTASGRLTDIPQGYALADLKLVHEAATIAGEAALTRGDKRFKISAKGRSPLLDISKFAPPPGEKSAPKSKAVRSRAIPDLPLPLNILRLIDADLELRFDAVKIAGTAPLGPLIAHATIADGKLKAEPVQLMVKAAQALNALATIDASQNAWALRVDGKGIDFGELLARLGQAGVVTGGSTDLAIRIEGRGKSSSEILASLDGEARVSIGPHRIHNFGVNLQSGLALRMFSLANPFQKSDPDTDVKCFAAALPVKNGVLASERNVALETAKYNVVASGTLNLRTERIDLVLTPVVRGEAGTMVRVGGTLAAPTMGLDAAGAARSAASLGAAIAAPAWLIADSVLKKAVSDPNPCKTALGAPVSSR